MFDSFTAVLVRTNGTARVLASATDEQAAKDAINQNWQHRNHPENARLYVLINDDSETASTFDPHKGAGLSASKAIAPLPKRPALA